MPSRPVFGEQAGGAHQARNVHIVAAGVRDRHLLPRAIGLRVGAGVRKARLLLHRQRVHVGAHEHGGAITVTQDPDDAGRADLVMHIIPSLAQRICCNGRRVHLLVGELRVSVELTINVFLPLPDCDPVRPARGPRTHQRRPPWC